MRSYLIEQIQSHAEENNNIRMTQHNIEQSIFTFSEIIEQNVITKNFRSVYKSNILLNRKY